MEAEEQQLESGFYLVGDPGRAFLPQPERRRHVAKHLVHVTVTYAAASTREGGRFPRRGIGSKLIKMAKKREKRNMTENGNGGWEGGEHRNLC